MIFAVVYSPGPAWIEGKSIEDQPLENHVQYLMQLYRRRVLLLGGPFLDDAGGLVVIEAQTVAEAERFIRDDPANAVGTLTARLHPWHIAFARNLGRRLRGRPSCDRIAEDDGASSAI